MSWMSWIPTIIEGIGLLKDKDNASSPTPVEPLDLEALARLMTMNTKSPWGGMEYTQGDDGRYTAEYSLGETQPIFDRAVDRSLNPDQAYQMPDELRQLQSALMQQRLGNVGAVNSVAPRPERRQYQPGGGQFQGPFAPAGSAAPAPQGSAPSVHRDPGSYSSGYGGGGGYGLGAGGAFGTAAPAFGGSPSSGGGSSGFNDYLNRAIPGAQQGSDPGRFEQGLVENAGPIGSALGGLLGVPGGGMLGNALADRYWQNNAWQSPATNLPPSGNDLINQAVNDNPGSAASLRDLAGGNQSSAGQPRSEFHGTLGSWHGFKQPGGGIKWIHSRSLTNDN